MTQENEVSTGALLSAARGWVSVQALGGFRDQTKALRASEVLTEAFIQYADDGGTRFSDDYEAIIHVLEEKMPKVAQLEEEMRGGAVGCCEVAERRDVANQNLKKLFDVYTELPKKVEKKFSSIDEVYSAAHKASVEKPATTVADAATPEPVTAKPKREVE